MRYIGIIKTGNDVVSVERLFNSDQVQRILPGDAGTKLITGTLINPSRIRGLLVEFYSENRESQIIRMDPLQKIILKNQPCDRLIISRPPNEPIAFFDYTFRIISAESTQEEMILLSTSYLEVDTESDNSIDYVESDQLFTWTAVTPRIRVIAFNNMRTEEIVDQVTVVGAAPTPPFANNMSPIIWTLFERGAQTMNPIRYHGLKATSVKTLVSAEWDRVITLQETSTEDVELAIGYDSGEIVPHFPLQLTLRLRSLRAMDAIMYSPESESLVSVGQEPQTAAPGAVFIPLPAVPKKKKKKKKK